MGVDRDAEMELMLLAQYNDEGKRAANSVVGKLLKHKTDGIQFKTNASAYVHGCVLKARHAIEGSYDRSYRGGSSSSGYRRHW